MELQYDFVFFVLFGYFLFLTIFGTLFRLHGFYKPVGYWCAYRTSKACENVERWKEAQRYAGRRMLQYAYIAIVLAFGSLPIDFDLWPGGLLPLLFLAFSLVMIRYSTEKHLREFMLTQKETPTVK